MNSKAWTSRWQETVGKTVNAAAQVAAENAARLRQGFARGEEGFVPSAESSPSREPELRRPEPSNVIRIPREAAAKLRWFDAADVASLVEAHTREKLALNNSIAALKQALAVATGGDEAAVDQQLVQQLAEVEKQQAVDDAIDGILLLAAQEEMEAANIKARTQEEEVERLREEAAVREAQLEKAQKAAASASEEAAALKAETDAQAREMADLRQRLLHLEPTPCPGTPTFAPGRQPFRMTEDSGGGGGHHPRRGLSTCSSEDGGHSQEAADAVDDAGPSAVGLPTTVAGPSSASQDHPSTGGVPAAGAGDEDSAEPVWGQRRSDGNRMDPHAGPEMPLRVSSDGRVDLLRVRSNELYGEDGLQSTDVSPDRLVPLSHGPPVVPVEATPSGAAATHNQATLADSNPHSNGWAGPGAHSHASAKLEGEPTEAPAAEAAGVAEGLLLSKLRAVEEERMVQQEEVARLSSLVGTLERAAAAAEEEKTTLRERLEATDSELAALKESSEQRLEELRDTVAKQAQRGKERLQKASAIVVEAEERAMAGEKRADEATARATRAEADLRDALSRAQRLAADVKDKEAERDRAESRAAAAETALADARHRGASEAEKGGALASALATQRKAFEEREAHMKQQSRETEASLRQRISKLDQDNQDLRRNVARAGAEVEALEKRVNELDSLNGQLQAELRAADMAAADRDELAARVQALEDRLQETRTQHNTLVNYKQIVAQQEAKKAEVEEDLHATVQIVKGLESRLQAAQNARDTAQQNAAAADRRAQEAEERVAREVARRLDAIGADVTLWPKAAREEVSRLEKRLEALNGLLSSLQSQLDQEADQHQAALVSQASLQVRLGAAEERAQRAEREGRDAAARLERALKAAQAETADWRREAAAAEAERDKLQAVQNRRAGARSGVPLRKGGGGLLSIVEEATNGRQEREQMQGVDIVYLKNVLLKFLDAHASGLTEQCEVLLPAVATLLRASPEEFKAIKKSVHDSPVHTINKVTRGWL